MHLKHRLFAIQDLTYIKFNINLTAFKGRICVMWQMNRKYSKLNYQWSKQACNNILSRKNSK
uniref:Uncharacterized protein n=1 Tax=Anguilla anguilla TaxID=7936 RepID=A0A0E9UA32_ANGAN